MATMGLADALAPHVDERIRTKGNRYFLGGAVRAIEGSPTAVTATVRGSEWYQVHLTRTGDEVLASCGCPFFTDRNDFCKHIWAVILAADSEGYLLDDTPLTRKLYLESAYTDLGLDEAADVGFAEGAAMSRSLASRQATLEPWEQFLKGVSLRVAARAAQRPPRYVHGEFLYVIGADESAAELLPLVQLQWRTRKKNGEWGKPQAAPVSPVELDSLPESSDRQILSMLLGAGDLYGFGGYTSLAERASFRPAGPLVERVLPLLAQTGRLYQRSPPSAAGFIPSNEPMGRFRFSGSPLGWDGGSPWQFRLEVRPGDPIALTGSLVRDHESIAVTDAPALARGFLVVRGAVARVDDGGALPWLLELRRSGAVHVPESAAPLLIEALARSDVDPANLPAALRYERFTVSPRPRVKVSRGHQRPGRGSRDDLEARVDFDYGGVVLPARADAGGYDAATRRMIRRDRVVELAAFARLQQLGFARQWYSASADDALAIAVDRFPGAVRTLVDEGWHVEAEGRVFRAARAMQMHVKSGVDWFELHGEVDFGGNRTVPVSELLAALRRGEATVILDDGTRGMLPEAWLKRYARVAAFGEAAGDHVRYRPSQAVLLDALLETQPAVSVDEAFARARAELGAFRGVAPLDPPPSFRGRLREYQREALGWFDFLRRFGFGGCLADDMGLGKTVMVLALLEARRGTGRRGGQPPSVVVVPRSLVFNWMDEAARFAPRLRMLDYTGESRASAVVEDHDVVLTTYGTLRRDAARLSSVEFDYVILDEAQAIKNPSTASAKAARLLRGRHCLALSGTPIENHLGELWSLFEFLNPGFLGSAAAFDTAFAGEGRGRSADLPAVGRALRPFILRRTKEQVAPELPDRIEQTIHCELDPAQRRFYDSLREHYRGSLLARVAEKGLNRSKIQVLEALLRLRQAASHPGLVDERRTADASAKFEVLLDRLREVVDEGHKALVFSQFTTLLALLRTRLEREAITYEYLDGRTRDRGARVARFEADPGCPVFLISLKAGGVGLNLTAAGYVFLLDPWWNPAVEAQAIDRAHRIGQSKHVFAYRLIARDTVEEKIAELQRAKRDLADAVLTEDAAMLRALSAEDLDWLLR